MGAASAQQALHEIITSAELGYLSSFEPLGDINGDGVCDFLYGEFLASRHVVRSGSDWSTLATITETQPGPALLSHGHSVDGVGDWNGDGTPDYAVGETGYSPGDPSVLWQGRVRLYSGADHSVLQDFTHGIEDEHLGYGVRGLGDITGDGWPEVAMWGYQTGPRKLYIYSAPSGNLLRVHEGYETWVYDPVSLSDLDGDGIRDYAFGAPFFDSPHFLSGRVVVFSGATGAEIRSLEGGRLHELVGHAIARGGDWDFDGVEDIVAGGPGSSSLISSQDYPMGVYVFSGADGHILRHFDGPDYVPGYVEWLVLGPGFGYDVDSGHDVNGDGFPDLIVGAPNSESHGAALVLSGRTGATLWYQRGIALGDDYGKLVSFLDDHDGDGLAEWVVVDTDFEVNGQTVGRISIYRGAVGERWSACGGAASGVVPEARLSASGAISLGENDFQLAVESATPNTVGFLLVGGDAPAAPFGLGRLCLGAPLGLVASLATDAAGNAWTVVDLGGSPFDAPPLALAPGDTRAFQFAYRDAQSGARRTSDSVVVRFLP